MESNFTKRSIPEAFSPFEREELRKLYSTIVPRTGETWTRHRDGAEYLYCWVPETGETGWLDRSDILLPLEEMEKRGNL